MFPTSAKMLKRNRLNGIQVAFLQKNPTASMTLKEIKNSPKSANCNYCEKNRNLKEK